MKQSGSCRCGSSKFRVNGDSLCRFFCHCTICQSVYKQPFADVTAFRARDVEMPVNSKLEFRRLRSPPALNRGFCPECHMPVVGFLSLIPGLGIAFVPSANLPDKRELPKPFAHIFYQSRAGDVSDAVPKVSGYWRSEGAVGQNLIPAFFRQSAQRLV